MTLSRSSDSQHALTPRQAHLIGTLRRSREDWLELWELSRRAGYTIKITAANVRELRRLGLVVTRPTWNSLSTIEVSLRGPS
jgi:DNA-binding MarR family transcriptional regulator